MIRALLVFLVLVGSLFIMNTPVSAQQTITCPDGRTVSVGSGAAGAGVYELCLAAAQADCNDRSFLGLPSWHKYLEKSSRNGRCEITGPADPDNSTQLNWPRVVGYVAIALVEILLRVASLVAVGYVIYGGFRYITSQGEPENAKSARQTIINAVIGLVIAIASASIVSFLGNRLG